jgi:hypothetical protein
MLCSASRGHSLTYVYITEITQKFIGSLHVWPANQLTRTCVAFSHLKLKARAINRNYKESNFPSTTAIFFLLHLILQSLFLHLPILHP